MFTRGGNVCYSLANTNRFYQISSIGELRGALGLDIAVDPTLDFADSDFIDFIDFTNLPVFTPDLENYVAPKCNYIDVDKLYPYISGLSLSILLLNIRSLKRNFNGFFCLNFIIILICLLLLF